MAIRRFSYFFFFIIGTALIVIGTLPSVFAYPYSDGPNSGPSNTGELALMISYEGWKWFLIIGLVLSVFSLLKIRKQ
ncbi:hypothetical protein PAECIP111891_07007 [Paenibacillus allorhizoplanae]|uniref:LPXTG cell wall anchor domain-containing protein n=1 Tax=Paenibacillus allorhizoplanae TaxID=2905648 RepID=A0ABM9CZ59_9BACL|nr:hypothetical protein [Paenibacillus allorhizoplanae]CAH1232450.1 hypothetical protein PAECIP111891_07007 [Paenibacillus allorhizoplanae]